MKYHTARAFKRHPEKFEQIFSDTQCGFVEQRPCQGPILIQPQRAVFVMSQGRDLGLEITSFPPQRPELSGTNLTNRFKNLATKQSIDILNQFNKQLLGTCCEQVIFLYWRKFSDGQRMNRILTRVGSFRDDLLGAAVKIYGVIPRKSVREWCGESGESFEFLTYKCLYRCDSTAIFQIRDKNV